ncbi:MAG: hypothetical protein GF347_01325 [Candidatus Moranbacteria bacterium]|nr:hypothetical protein [Candidatus Moranbacteria bacterium]
MSKSIKILIGVLAVVIVLAATGVAVYFKWHLPKITHDYLQQVEPKFEEVATESENLEVEDDMDQDYEDPEALMEELDRVMEEVEEFENKVKEAKEGAKGSPMTAKMLERNLIDYYDKVMEVTLQQKEALEDLDDFMAVLVDNMKIFDEISALESEMGQLHTMEEFEMAATKLEELGTKLEGIGDEFNSLSIENEEIKKFNEGMGKAMTRLGGLYKRLSVVFETIVDLGKSGSSAQIEETEAEIDQISKDLTTTMNEFQEEMAALDDLDKVFKANVDEMQDKEDEVRMKMQELKAKY